MARDGSFLICEPDRKDTVLTQFVADDFAVAVTPDIRRGDKDHRMPFYNQFRIPVGSRFALSGEDAVETITKLKILQQLSAPRTRWSDKYLQMTIDEAGINNNGSAFEASGYGPAVNHTGPFFKFRQGMHHVNDMVGTDLSALVKDLPTTKVPGQYWWPRTTDSRPLQNIRAGVLGPTFGNAGHLLGPVYQPNFLLPIVIVDGFDPAKNHFEQVYSTTFPQVFGDMVVSYQFNVGAMQAAELARMDALQEAIGTEPKSGSMTVSWPFRIFFYAGDAPYNVAAPYAAQNQCCKLSRGYCIQHDW